MARARDLIAAEPGVVLAEGAVQLEAGPKDADRFDRIAHSPLFAEGAVARLNSAAAGKAVGEVAHAGGLRLTESLVVEPERLTTAWLAGAERRRAKVARIAPHAGGWALCDADGGQVATADVVCVAAGPASPSLVEGLPLRTVRGQVSMVEGEIRPAPALWGGYLIPTRSGYLFGATHDRDDVANDVRAEDHARNLAELAKARPVLAANLSPGDLTGRASHRAVTPDFLPLAGAVPGPAGLYVLSGLGSRGFCAAPLLAEHVAALATGAPSPLPAALSDILDPARFELRRNRRLARSTARK
jgi:tRNA 5-methylaminomethyl-2-thiouridine biosynthesis bifunctional protein